MFKFLWATALPGFRVGPSEDQPGFAVAEDGSCAAPLPLASMRRTSAIIFLVRHPWPQPALETSSRLHRRTIRRA